MSRGALPWHGRPGLAGGIDPDGSRAAELLGLGFGSVEFGTVAPDASLTALVGRLVALPLRQPGAAAIGIGLGLSPDRPHTELAQQWLAGLAMACPVADYLSFNLSARARRPLLAPGQLPRVAHALAAVAAARNALPSPLALALKIPLGEGEEPLPAVAEAAAEAGFDALTVVLPEDGTGPSRLAALVRRLGGGPALVAVGGIRSASHVAAALAAGASGVQVHRLFAELGAGCLPILLRSGGGSLPAGSAASGGGTAASGGDRQLAVE